jgi:hypothetical protein
MNIARPCIKGLCLRVSRSETTSNRKQSLLLCIYVNVKEKWQVGALQRRLARPENSIVYCMFIFGINKGHIFTVSCLDKYVEYAWGRIKHHTIIYADRLHFRPRQRDMKTDRPTTQHGIFNITFKGTVA